MSSNPTPEVSAVRCIALFEGTTIEDSQNPLQVTGLSFLEMGENRKVKIPGEVDLNIPQLGTVKASTGTPVKLPTGTIVGHATGAAPPPVSIRVPACTLVEPSKNLSTKLSDGTRIVTPSGGIPFLVLEAIEFEPEPANPQ